ncbi:glycosyltransferase family 2 protein [Calothrix sp. NIES-3974]|uniref:glycosyltransferase family 2 protein n=1 Tax=Calothrix sp. NIES-3974 TaxID=2005462 RepID=UPI000B5EBA14|nr:glycosyltransferase family A protein [Calothrix sp. NIES-3974]BAZ04931.1 family 2 glycosyl transferase [Calothrix sp. NIES-3974]
MGVTTDLPLVSVIIPAYNAERFIEQTLASVCHQTYPNLEIIIVDDGSRDRTVEILRQWERNDSRVQLITQANAGVAAARNLAISYSQSR